MIKNGRLWDGSRFFRGDVLTEEGYIAQIAERIDADARFVYDAAGKTVSTGLVDLHVHMQGVSNHNIGINAEMSSFPFGVTAAVDCGAELGDEAFLNNLAVKNLVFVSIRAVDGIFDVAATEARLQKYGKRAAGLKVYFDTNIKACPALEQLQKICTYSRAHGLKVMVHCSNSPASMAEIVNVLNPGDILTHIYHGGVNSCTEDEFASLLAAREKGIVLDAGFAAHVHADLSKFRQAVRAGVLPDTISISPAAAPLCAAADTALPCACPWPALRDWRRRISSVP